MCTQSDESHNFWDTLIKVIAAISVSVSLLLASCQYKEKVENEHMAPLWKKQIDVYSKVVSIVGDATHAKNKTEREKKLVELRKVFAGEISVVGDFTVTLPIANFINTLDDCIVADNCSVKLLSPLSSIVSKCARVSLGTTWNRTFDEMVDNNPKQVDPGLMCK
ncbi:hypothetical protein [Shewanella woodyi]|uniref:hypothetical protein n=1 Tax=Shewanella woodyi TaxID=60961 RepID=UPI0007F9160C|nr:hypothetical protein [Shewanella woodyi]